MEKGKGGLGYREDGRLEVDHNAAERALRAAAIGRNKWLFAGSNDGGERAAAIYALIGTAKLNDLDPERYLRHILARIPDHPINKIDALLLWNVVLVFSMMKARNWSASDLIF